jgi:hypothetical protein
MITTPLDPTIRSAVESTMTPHRVLFIRVFQQIVIISLLLCKVRSMKVGSQRLILPQTRTEFETKRWLV